MALGKKGSASPSVDGSGARTSLGACVSLGAPAATPGSVLCSLLLTIVLSGPNTVSCGAFSMLFVGSLRTKQ